MCSSDLDFSNYQVPEKGSMSKGEYHRTVAEQYAGFIYSMHYGERYDSFYFRYGKLENITLGDGALLSSYYDYSVGYLESRPGTDRIRLYIDSPGGEVASGLMIYDVLQAMSKEVDIYCMGCAESMAALLLACGRPGHRHILPHARTMIHEPQLETGLGGSATSIRHLSDSIMETRNMLNQLLVKHTGRTIREINKATSFDNFMNADESIEFGLCDDIVTDLF